MKLHRKIALTIILILMGALWGVGLITLNIIDATIDKQNENSVMDLAYSIATMESVQKALARGNDYNLIQDRIEDIRVNTRFQYIIVLDMNKIRYSYPNEYGLGKEYIGIGAEEVLRSGDPQIFHDSNQFISAIWGGVPIFYEGNQVGGVLVGLLDDAVKSEIAKYHYLLYTSIILAMIIGGIAAWFLSKSIKDTIFGLEPKEIAVLMGERDLILHNLKHGILALDKDLKILFYNNAAANMLRFIGDYKGKYLLDVNKNLNKDIEDVLKANKSTYNQEVKIDETKTLLCSYKIIRNHRGEVIAILSSFQDLTEVKELAEELTDVKKITDALRAQSHEFSNKLYTISGLIQLEEYDKALDYITEISTNRRNIAEILNNNIKYPHLSAILLAKSNRASEAKINIEIDRESKLDKLPSYVSIDELCSVVGNLIENSIEALRGRKNGKIYVKIYSGEDSLKIEVKDNGPGINRDIREKIFTKGFSTKQGNRGYGLNIIKNIVDLSGGKIKLISEEGTEWVITIPMTREEL